MACIEIACAEGDTDCGRKCVGRCDEGRQCPVPVGCLSHATVDGAQALICPIKMGTGSAPCSEHSDCDTANCVVERCAPVEGFSKGFECAVPEDCFSGSCANGKCRGASKVLEPCAEDEDCAEGVCCAKLCAAAGTC
jgi:hypothetical protein